MALSALNVLSLCTGIGGIELGLELAGEVLGFRFRTVCMVEREIYAAAILAQQMEQGRLDACPIWSDIKTFPEVAHLFRGKVDLITGGYPCQPFSAAGQRKGTEDPRHIFPHICRIIEAVRPVFCFFENVSGHLSLGFPEVYQSLRHLGYAVEAGLFTAEEVGAPHRRERLFILAHTNRGRSREKYGICNSDLSPGSGTELADASEPRLQESGRLRELRQFGAEETGRLHDRPEHHNCTLGNSDLTGPQGREQSERSGGYELPAWPPGPPDARWAEIIQQRPDLAPAVAYSNHTRLSGGKEQDGDTTEKQQGVDRGNFSGCRSKGRDQEREGHRKQATQPPLCRVADGIPDWLDRVNANRVDRLRCLGNAVVPPTAAKAFITLWRKMMENTDD